MTVSRQFSGLPTHLVDLTISPYKSIDTGEVDHLLNDIPEQTNKARTIIANSPCCVTDVVLTEIIYVLERVIEMERADIAHLVKAFLSLPNLIYNDYFLDQAIDLYRAKSALSFVDCYAATESKVYNNNLATFDKALAKRGGSHVKAYKLVAKQNTIWRKSHVDISGRDPVRYSRMSKETMLLDASFAAFDVTPLASSGGDGASMPVEGEDVDLQALQVESDATSGHDIRMAKGTVADGDCKGSWPQGC